MPLLSEATVATGTSDPLSGVSKMTTGTPDSFARSISAGAPSWAPSWGANPMPSGLSLMALCSWLSCLSPSDSVSGPLKLTSTPSSLPAASAPSFTFTQYSAEFAFATSATRPPPELPPEFVDWFEHALNPTTSAALSPAMSSFFIVFSYSGVVLHCTLWDGRARITPPCRPCARCRRPLR